MSSSSSLSIRASFFFSSSSAALAEPRRFLAVQTNPAGGNYVMAHAFEEPTLRFICEGTDVDYKNETREALLAVLPPRAGNFTREEEEEERAIGGGSSGGGRPSQATLRLFRALCKRRLASFAQVRSTPQRLSSFYETLATADPALAMLAADHFTAAGILSTHARTTTGGGGGNTTTTTATEHHRMVTAALDGADSGKLIGCLAHRELIADGPPLNTEARFDAHERCFVLRGTGKFAIVAAEFADWAVVTATLTLGKNENNGAHLFFVSLREGGALRPGISLRPVSKTESPVTARAGVAVVHFENVRLPEESLFGPFVITAEGRVDYMPSSNNDGSGGTNSGTDASDGLDGRADEEQQHDDGGASGKKKRAPAAKSSSLFGAAGSTSFSTTTPATEVLQTRVRLATAAVYVGVMKTLLTNIIHCIAQKDVLGHDHRRTHPYFGLQHVQTPLVGLVSKAFVYLTVYQRLLPAFAGEGNKPASYEEHMALAGTVHFLQETINDLARYAHDFMGVHAALASSGIDAALTTVHLRNEGGGPDQSLLIREVAFKSITKNIGTSHWGWYATSLLQAFPSLDRFVKNPMYSPRIAEMGRHLIFFSHKHYGLKTRLRRSREFERRKGGGEHQWYDWTMFRHREVVHCGEAFMEMRAVEAMMEETQNCQDPRGRKMLRDLGWIYALVRQTDRLEYILASKMMSPSKAVILTSHLDNLVTVMAPQCGNLADAMQVPARFRAPCSGSIGNSNSSVNNSGAGEADLEPYWTIPGTNTHIQRGDRVTLYDAAEQQQQQQRRQSSKKGPGAERAEQESMREETGEFDLFHGLTDEPAFDAAGNKTNRREGESKTKRS